MTATSPVIATPVKKRVNLTDVKVNDVFSESSHYKLVDIANTNDPDNKYKFLHIESKIEVYLGSEYIEQLLNTADQYEGTSVKVGKEDKYWTQKQIDDWVTEKAKESNAIPSTIPRVGDVRLEGIRSIWDNIHTDQVFMVGYYKVDKKKSKKQLDEERSLQLTEAINRIEAAKTGKKGVASVASEIIKELQLNPISDIIPGELRVLRGYKLQFNSRDGKYDCFDMDEMAVRPVNILTIQWLVIDNVKYEVE